jgi:hypothetical protein
MASPATEGLAEATITDYWERATWLLQEFGEATDIAEITYDRMEAVWRKWRGVIRNVTVKKRFIVLMAALKLAHARGRLDRVPTPPDLKHDGQARTTVHTVAQWEAFREFMPPGRYRDIYDLGVWTGHHISDLFTLERWHLDPDKPVLDERGKEVARGMFWRRNAKNASGQRKVEPIWVPMEPELALLSRDILARTPPLKNALVVGKTWNVRRTLHMAADRAAAAGYEIPRCSPNDLRRSYSSMLIGRGYHAQYVRIALGHQGEFAADGKRVLRPTTADRHYFQVTPALLSQRPAEPPAAE